MVKRPAGFWLAAGGLALMWVGIAAAWLVPNSGLWPALPIIWGGVIMMYALRLRRP